MLKRFSKPFGAFGEFSSLWVIVFALSVSQWVVGCAVNQRVEHVTDSQPSIRLEAPVAVSVAPPRSLMNTNKPLKVAFLYVSPIGGGGWTYAHEMGRQALVRELGDRIQTTYIENVPESDDAMTAIHDVVMRGSQLVFGTSFGYLDPIYKAASTFSPVKFEHISGYRYLPNLRTYDSRNYEGAYLAGVIAGKMSQTATLGVVASIPIPEVIRNINSFTLGAQSVNPKVKTKVVWVNGWFDPPKEAEAASSLIDSGADVLFQTTDSTAVLKTAQQKGKRAFGWDSDMSTYAPNAHLASAINNWGPYYIKATHDVLEGTWTSGNAWWGVKEGAIDLVSIADDVPSETKAKIDEIKKGLIDGSFSIWKGPLVDNTGSVQIVKGVEADDAFLHRMNFYVKGVDDMVPGSK